MNFLTSPASPAAVAEDRLVVERPTANAEVPILVQYWDAVYRRKYLILAILAGCIALAVVLTALTTPQYTATSRIEISRSQANVTNVESLQPEDAAENDEFYQTQYALLQARSLAERVVRQLNLAQDDAFFERFDVDPSGQGLIADEGGAGTLSAAERQRRQRMATSILLDNVTIAPIRGSSLVNVEFQSPDPAFSALVVNTWVDEFIASNLDRRFASTADAREFLEQRLAELRGRLEQSERRLVSYASNKEIVTLSTQSDAEGRTTSERTLVSTDLEALNAELADATAARIAAQSELGGGVSREIVSNPTIAALRERRADVAAQYAKLLAQFEPGYPAAQALEQQIEGLDRSIAREEARVHSAARTDYTDALQREQTLNAKVNDLKQRFIQQQRDTIQYNIFQRDVDTNRQLYDALLQRFKEIGVAGVGTNNVAVVDRAQVPTKPSSPSLVLNLALALLAGLGLSGVVVFALEQIDQSLKDPADVARLLDLTFLGAVPRIQGAIDDELKDKKSIASEAYLSIQTNLSFLTDHGVPKTLLLTSTRPSEGKSNSTYALSETLTKTGKQVVVVDADMRNPSIHEHMDMQNVAGLSNYLSGDDNFSALVRPTHNPQLAVMTAGPTPPNAAELLSSDRMHNLIARLSSEYDHVLVDAPPVLGIADIPLLAGTVEGVLYTIEANGPKVRAIRSALQRLRSARANIFGAIVTKLDQRNASYGYGDGYGYGYGYGPEVKK